MSIPNVDSATLSFRLRVLDPVNMSQNRPAVMDAFRAVVLEFDPTLAKQSAWQNVPFKPHHDWAVAQAVVSGTYDIAAFQTAYALATSEVFFLHGVDTASGWSTASGTGLAHPAVGDWTATPARAVPGTFTDAIYVWEQDANTGQWVRVCYSDFGLVDAAGSPTGMINMNGVDIAQVGLSLAYGDHAGLLP